MCVIIFNPLFVQHVEVTTYLFSHSLTIGFSLLFSYLMLHVEAAKQINSACLVIMFGVCISSMGYLNFSLVGGFYALAWPTVVAIYGIYLKKTLISLRNDFW
jgi:GDP-fucose transporter C1